MTELGTRTIDDLGRIVLPTSLRHAKDWAVGSKITFYNFNGIIVMEACTPEQESGQISNPMPDLAEVALNIN